MEEVARESGKTNSQICSGVLRVVLRQHFSILENSDVLEQSLFFNKKNIEFEIIMIFINTYIFPLM